MKVWLVHPTGSMSMRAVLRGLAAAGCDPVFCTTIAFPQAIRDAAAMVWSTLALELERRTFPEISYGRVRTFPAREVIRQIAGRVGLRPLVRHETGWACTDAVYRALDRAVARSLRRSRERPSAVYCYDDGALATFEVASSLGILRVYHLPTPYWRATRQILEEERQRRPDWAETMGGLRDSPAKLARKDLEIELAEIVVVPSAFVARTLDRFPGKRVRTIVVPYGCEPPRPDLPFRREHGQPLRILFAGSLGQQKGVADLFEALDRLGVPHELTLAGPCPWRDCKALRRALDRPNRRWLGAVPRPVLMRLMCEHHVFVFPSLFEGLALVLTEALANGLPIVASTNSGAEELLSADGIEGFVVPIRDPDAIAGRLTWMYENENRRMEMAEAAKRRAAGLSWRRFETRIGELLAGRAR